MKRILQIFTFILVVSAGLFFLAGQSLDYFVFKYRQSSIRKEIKKEIKAGVDDKELFIFSVEEIIFGNLEWEKPGKEFKKAGAMYDIVKLELSNGKLVYKCIRDDKEEQLFSDLDELVKNRMADDSSDDFLKNLLKDFTKVPAVYSSLNSFSENSDKEKTAYLFSVSKIYFHLNIPPPKLG